MILSLRVARPTDRLEALAAQYRDGLGLARLGEFAAHDGFDGVMLGPPGGSWHLELTREAGVAAGRAPSAEHLLALYLEESSWPAACARALAAGFVEVPAHNPYWDRVGRSFEDLDGYRVVLVRGPWPR